MTELRQDPFTRAWVAIAPERADRPQPTRATTPAPVARPAFDPACPFCPGNEDQTPGELWRTPDAAAARDCVWRVRVVPNRYPVLADDGHTARHHTDGRHTWCDGVGSHEVVIESPRHDWDLADGGLDAVTEVLRAYRALRDRCPGLILPFRNHGVAAGTSQPHPHSQLIATPVVLLRVRCAFDVARAYYDDHGTCLHTDEVRAELAAGQRVIATTDHLAALTPYAAQGPYETWIVPRHHQATFADTDDQDIAETAGLLHRLLASLRDLLGDIPYNYAIVSAPAAEEQAGYFSWHLQLQPRLTATAGFEIGSGIAVNPLPPEDAAARLRHAFAHQQGPQTARIPTGGHR